MSKLQDAEPPEQDKLNTVDEPVGIKRGKKRKSKGGTGSQTGSRFEVKKGTGKLMTFDDSNSTDGNLVEDEEAEQRGWHSITRISAP